MNDSENYLFGCTTKDVLTKDDIDTILKAFGASKEPTNKKQLSVNENKRSNIHIPAGFTYFGQFISHDIVPHTNPTSKSSRRIVSPRLNLDSLYGHHSSHHIFFDEKGFFRPSPTVDVDKVASPSDADLLRDNLGNVIIPETRNTENLIVMQFHRLWQKIHNFFVKANLHSSKSNAFESAKQATIAIFQLITIDDYLKRLLLPEVYAHYFEQSKPGLLTENESFNRVPFEFSHAAFRFGHSMVNTAYTINREKIDEHHTCKANSRTLKELMGEKPPKPIDKTTFIEWENFFELSPSTCNVKPAHSSIIDLTISSSMLHIVPLNINAAVNIGIKNGFEIIQDLKNNSNLKCFFNNYTVLKEPHLTRVQSLKYLYDNKKLPLWLYVLDEAGQKAEGNRLGTLASLIIADVIRKSIFEYCQKDISPTLTYKSYRVALIENLQINCALGCDVSNKINFKNDLANQDGFFTISNLLNFIEKKQT